MSCCCVTLRRRFSEFLVLLEEASSLPHQSSLIHVWPNVAICVTSSQLLTLNRCLNLSTCLIFVQTGASRGPHRDSQQQVHNPIPAMPAPWKDRVTVPCSGGIASQVCHSFVSKEGAFITRVARGFVAMRLVGLGLHLLYSA